MTEKSIITTDKEIGNYLASKKTELAKYASREYNQNGFYTSVIICINEDSNLQRCLKTDKGQRSLYNALKKAARTGLSLNPAEGEACLTAWGDKVQYQIMKNGLIKLALETDQVAYLSADIVRANDFFEIIKQLGSEDFKHKPARKDRGDVDGFYAAILFKGGNKRVDYMSTEEVKAHALQYSASYRNWVAMSKGEKQSNKPPAWETSFNGQGIKTVMKKLLRNTHMSHHINVSDSEDETEEGIVIESPETERLSTDVF